MQTGGGRASIRTDNGFDPLELVGVDPEDLPWSEVDHLALGVIPLEEVVVPRASGELLGV